ncbi:hypothetical protein E2C01_096481 [Portunus trituberculatus]|uniref:Uncharacterized protein n=1 Tax=Portunus trituberculatus TaxID=210409 RepID=A0A5B7JY24_PORTR|nr:hypothetical protein [Portunus trituberculatus]
MVLGGTGETSGENNEACGRWQVAVAVAVVAAESVFCGDTKGTRGAGEVI